jgi:hypothetical protein
MVTAKIKTNIPLMLKDTTLYDDPSVAMVILYPKSSIADAAPGGGAAATWVRAGTTDTGRARAHDPVKFERDRAPPRKCPDVRVDLRDES